MQVKIKDLLPNPFKKYINEGKFNKERIEILIESIEHGTLPQHFYARKKGSKFELVAGHHRIEALTRKFGEDHKVDITTVIYSDEEMLIDMVRENMTQRNTDFQDKKESVVLAREWLRSGSRNVKQFNIRAKRDNKGKFIGSEPIKDSYRSIAKFLSKHGKAICYGSVKNYLNIHDNLSKELVEEVGNGLTLKDAVVLSKIESKEEQKEVKIALDNIGEGDQVERGKLVTQYKNLPTTLKKEVREGRINLDELKDVSPHSLSNGEMVLQFHKRLSKLSADCRTIRRGLMQFREGSLFNEFTPHQNEGFHSRMKALGKEQEKLLDEIVRCLGVLSHEKKRQIERIEKG